jgi:hypothetical protein
MAGFWQSAAALVIGGAAVLWARDHFKQAPTAGSAASPKTIPANPPAPMRAERITPGAVFDPVTIQSGGTQAVQPNDINRMRDAAGRP